MAEDGNRTDNERYVIEQAIARLDSERERIDAFMLHVKWIVSVTSSIVIVIVGFVSILGISNLNEISAQLAENARSQVRIAIDSDESNMRSIEQ